MSLDDLLEPKVLLAAGVTAALMSPSVRGALRKGVVYGLAGILMAGDKLAAAGIAREHEIDPAHHLIQVVDVIDLRSQKRANGGDDQTRGHALGPRR